MNKSQQSFKPLLWLCVFIFSFQQIGYSQWSSDPSVNTKVSDFGVTPFTASDEHGGAIIFFASLGQTKAYVQRIDRTGFIKWNNGSAIQVGGYLKNQSPKAVCSDGSGGAYLQYIETDKTIPTDTGKILVFINRIDSNGNLVWNGKIGIDTRFRVFSGSSPYVLNDFDIPLYKLISSAESGCYFAWVDSAHPVSVNNEVLKLQRINPDGSNAFGEYGMSLTQEIPYDQVSDIVSDGQGGAIVSTASEIFHVDRNGNNVFTDSSITIQGVSYYPQINSIGRAIICPYVQYIELSKYSNYYLKLVDSIGSTLWDKKFLDSVDINLAKPKILTNDSNSILLYWQDNDSNGHNNIDFLKIGKDGIYNKNNIQKVVSVSDSEGIGDFQPFEINSSSIIIVWTQTGIHYYYTVLDSGGNNLLGTSKLLNTHPTDDGHIHGINNQEKGVITAWYEIGMRNGIFAQNIKSNGGLGPTKVNDFKKIHSIDFELKENYPNPFNPTTMIDYQLATGGLVILSIYDILGREILTIVKERQSAGAHSVKFDATKLTSGVYFYQLQMGGLVETKKMVVVK